MFETTAEIGSYVLAQCWKFFQIQVPGFSLTFGQMLFGIAICNVSILVLRVFFGIGGKGVIYRAASSRRPKISENRKGDEY